MPRNILSRAIPTGAAIALAATCLVGTAQASDVWAASAAQLVDDHRRICDAGAGQWTDLEVTKNDNLPDGTKITAIGDPVNGQARIVENTGFNRVQYKDVNQNGTWWTSYTVTLPNGTLKSAFWRVTYVSC